MTRGARASRSERVVLAALAVALAAPMLLLLRDDATVADKPLVEDAYYAFSVARHVALGHGATADGVHPTSGFQPLVTFLHAALAAVVGTDRATVVRIALVVSWAAFAAATFGVTRIAAALAPQGTARAAALLAGALWCASAHLWRQSFNGLETGVLLAALAGFWTLLLATPRRGAAGAVRIGAVAGVLVLLRVDAVLLVAALALHEAWRGRPLRAVAVGATAALVSSPWWIWNSATFGTPVPSGAAATEGAGYADPLCRAAMSDALASALAPQLWAWDALGLWERIARAVAAVAVVVLAVRRVRAPSESCAAYMPADILRVGALHAALLVVWYLARSEAYFFYARYLCVAAVLAVPLVAAALAGWAARRPGVLVGAGAVAAAIAVALPVASADPRLRYGNQLLRDQLPLVRRHVPDAEWVGAFQSGTLGYFRERVLNLDGKGNAEALRRRGDLDAYLRAEGVRWLCDTRTRLQPLVGVPGSAWREVARQGSFRLWRRDD